MLLRHCLLVLAVVSCGPAGLAWAQTVLIRGGGEIVVPDERRADPYRGRDPYWGSPYYGRGYGYAEEEEAYPDYEAPHQEHRQVPQEAALVEVRVPRDAVLWFSGEKTSQSGRTREFVTPELQDGKHYYYTIKASWTQDGKTVEHSRRVKVSPGAHVMVDFFRRAKAVKPTAASAK